MAAPAAWWQSFFDDEYLAIWGQVNPDDQSDDETAALAALLGIGPGTRVLDAPCGYGRHALRLAELGADVLGVDASEAMLRRGSELLRRAGPLPGPLELRRHDLRHRLETGGFDVALNLFSSLGYGSEDDDLAILGTLAAALRPGGRLFLDTMHRDVVVARTSRGALPSLSLEGGGSLVERPSFDPISGRMETVWSWRTGGARGERTASIRVYAVTELVRMAAAAGLNLVSAHAGISAQPFDPTAPDMGGRIGLLFARV